MQLSHGRSGMAASFTDPNLVSCGGLVPLVGLAERVGLRGLADRQLTVAGGAGHQAGWKVSGLVAGMAAGADSIADMDVLRHGGMGRLFDGIRGTVDVGDVPALVAVRSCPPARRGRVLQC